MNRPMRRKGFQNWRELPFKISDLDLLADCTSSSPGHPLPPINTPKAHSVENIPLLFLNFHPQLTPHLFSQANANLLGQACFCVSFAVNPDSSSSISPSTSDFAPLFIDSVTLTTNLPLKISRRHEFPVRPSRHDHGGHRLRPVSSRGSC
jgi:hypothetical protein